MRADGSSRLDRVHRTAELAANLGIVVVAVLGGMVLVRQLEGTANRTIVQQTARPAAAAPAARPPAPAVGAPFHLSGVDFASAEQTLVLALSTECHFCSDSGPFYRKVADQARRGGTRLVAVFPQPADDGRQFLAGLQVSVGGIVQAPMGTLGLRGTPTLVLVNRHGVVLNAWVGRLTADGESAVLAAVGTTPPRRSS